jgi:DNA repair exonuclease SbcCD ATPase subunit
MGDMKFICPRCDQSLVVDDSGAGVIIECPHCANSIQIPMRGRVVLEEIVALRQRIESVTAELLEARQVFTESENEAARTKALLTDAIRELSSTRQHLAEKTGELETLQTGYAGLMAQNAELTERFAESESARGGFEHQCEALRQSLSETQSRADAAALACRESAVELEQVRGALAAAQVDLEALRSERKEIRLKLAQTENSLAEWKEHATAARAESAARATELEAQKLELARIAGLLEKVTEERDQLAVDLKLSPELAAMVELRNQGQRAELELNGTKKALEELRRDLATERAERGALRKEKIELELKLAAAREALEGNKLQEDNEVLRALVERLNEELRELGANRRVRPRQSSSISGSMGELKRWVVSRAFITES